MSKVIQRPLSDWKERVQCITSLSESTLLDGLQSEEYVKIPIFSK
jgi:hypothetical protein